MGKGEKGPMKQRKWVRYFLGFGTSGKGKGRKKEGRGFPFGMVLPGPCHDILPRGRTKQRGRGSNRGKRRFSHRDDKKTARERKKTIGNGVLDFQGVKT